MLKYLFTCLSFFIVITISSGEIVDKFTENTSYRLPNNTYPQSYNVTLAFGNFDQTELTYSGTVSINIKILEDTNTITLHSSVEDFTDDIILRSDQGQINIEYEIDEDREFLIIKTANQMVLPKDKDLYIRIIFTGRIGSAVQGVYRGSYVDQTLGRRYFLATHMQPTYARRVFPCYDEPKFKSVFTIALTHGNKYHSISNMEMDSKIQLPSTEVLTIFKSTPLMSTYILGFVISDFKMVESKSNEVTHRVFSRPDQVGNLDFALNTAIASLKSFETYFNVSYDLEKLDQVALPTFNFGGMENYGIIFYREDSLLYEYGVTSLYSKEFSASNIVHEVCHKFVGNLLTYHWWSVLWMAEGFCRFYEYHMAHNIYPNMKLDELFAVEAMQSVLYSDSSPNTRPMTSYVETPAQIRRIFDSISYSKAASVIRMFQYALSEVVFREGMQIFLSKKTSNPKGIAEPVHFYEALKVAIKNDSFDIVRAFESWEHQAGYPVIFVERNYNGNDIKLTQKRFTDNIKDGDEYEELWSVPITYSSKNHDVSHTSVQFWMDDRQHLFKIDGLRPSHYFLMNIDQTGYYRVMYDKSNWILIANELNQSNFQYFSPNTRAMLIDDAAVFVEVEILDLRIWLELIRYLKHETEYVPWMSATNNLLYMRRMLNDGESKLYKDFQKFQQIIFTKVFETYGVIEKSPYEHHEKHIRNIALDWACQSHLPACLNETAVTLQRAISDPEFKLSVDHRSTVMCNGAISGNKAVFDDLWKSFENSNFRSERLLMLRTIGCIENYDILKNFIQLYKEVDDDEWFTVIQVVYLNGPIGLRVAMEFLDKNFKEFNEFINDRSAYSTLTSIFNGISNRIVTNELFEVLKELMERYEIPESTKRTIVSRISGNLEWIEKNSPTIKEFLDNYFNSSCMASFSFIILVFVSILQFLVK